MEDSAKYKNYIDFDWWHGVNKRTIDSWIENFDERELALQILNQVIFYNTPQMRKYTECLINLQKDRIFLQTINESGLQYIDDETLNQKWAQYLEGIRILPAKKSEDVVCSANRVIEYWRSELGENLISEIAHIPEHIKDGIHHFVLADDFAGSGSQMLGILDQEIMINDQRIHIGDISDHYSDIKIEVALYVIHAEAYRNITKKYKKIEILFIDYIDERLDYLNPDNPMFSTKTEEEAERFRNTVRELQEKLRAKESKYEKMRKYSLNIPIVFEHGCPNNALLLLFAKTETWHQLFERAEKEKKNDNSI